MTVVTSQRYDSLMKPVDQDIFVNDPQGRLGNCAQAAVASLLELDLNEVPHFVALAKETDRHWWDLIQLFAEARGLEADWSYEPYEGYALASGKSPRGDFRHVVVVLDGKLAHDPHYLRAGIEESDLERWVVFYVTFRERQEDGDVGRCPSSQEETGGSVRR